MGIDIYMRWDGITKKEKEAQYTGFSVTSGGVGYLREAYHGEPYATRVLVPEAFEAHGGWVKIKAATLRARLKETMATAQEREEKLYPREDAKIKKEAVKTYEEFVKLAERKEHETGDPVSILASY